MTKEILERRLEYAENRIVELEERVNELMPEDDGYSEVVKAYIFWSNEYTKLIEQIDDLEIADEKEKQAKKEKALDLWLRVAELGCKVAIPVMGIAASLALGKLAYVQDTNMVLCNGRIFPMAKDVVKMATVKI